MAGINFKSVNAINQERESLQNARKYIVEKAKHKYEKEEKRRQEASARGEDVWMLPSINDRIQSDKKTVDKAKKKQKKEKKKLKKEKKQRKAKKKKTHQSSESDDSSDSDSEAEQWVEQATTTSSAPSEAPRPMKGPSLQRDSWMEDSGMFDVPTTTRKEIRDKKQKEKDEKNAEISEKKETEMLKLELNPYWKDGGSGMPEEEKKKKSKLPLGGTGDQGLSWLRKSFQRCKEQAVEEGKSLEELAAERWGSLKKIEKMIADAEESQRKQSRGGNSPQIWKRHERSRSPNWRRDGSFSRRRRSNSRSPDRFRKSRSPTEKHFMKPGTSDSSNGSRSNRTFMRPDSSRSDESRSRSFMKPDESRSSSRSDESRSRSFTKPGESTSSSRSDESRSRSFMKPGDSTSSSRSDESRSRSFMKPDSSDSCRYPKDSDRDRKQFMKPSGDRESDRRESDRRESDRRESDRRESDHRESDRRQYSSSNTSQGSSRWRKPGYEKAETESHSERSRRDEESSKSRSNFRDHRSSRRKSVSSSETSSSSSSSESEVESSSEEEVTPAVSILSEQEMNELGAKILRADIMGDTAQAEELKAKLDAARKAKEENPQLAAGGREKRGEGDQEEIILTRTTSTGIVQPLPDAKHDREAHGKKRKRQKNVATHTGSGERERYFDDDDQHSLKSMVEREKMGTAEDQNAMFARLAGRATDKADEDYLVDDIILTKAARKQSEAQSEERDRSRSIMDHKKLSSAMEKCRFCFDKVPKHLIISIGEKAYLCLPNHRSLAAGHCLIVPMQHATSGTSVDEDVWQEIQTFRKCLVRMFESQDEDVVFMETSMHIKHLPHMSVECIPMEKETGDLAPIYFKKALQDVGPEWSQNKKVVDLSRKDLRHSIPKGFPYFSVDFGLQGGFAHVIEDEQTFPSYFGREIVGGMIDAEPGLWRKPHKEGFDVQRKKVLEFAEMWKPFDWTQDLHGK